MHKYILSKLAVLLLVLLPSMVLSIAPAIDSTAKDTTAKPAIFSYENLSLEQCIDIAMEHNLDMKVSKENVKISESSYRLSKGVTEPSMSLSGDNSRSSNKNESDSASLSASKYFTTGGTLSASAGTQRSDGANQDPSFSSNAQIGFSQPLLKGRGGTSVEATNRGLKILDEEIQITRALQDAKRSLVRNVTSSYYGLIGAQRNIYTAQQAVDDGERLLKVAKIKKEEGMVAKIDVTRSEVQLASKKAALVSARRSYETYLISFNEMLGLEMGTPISINTTIQYVERDIKLDDYIKLAFQNRLDWKKAQLSLERSAISLQISSLNRLPKLDFSVNYNASKSTTDFAESLKLRNADLTAGISWSIPLWEDYRKVKESYNQAKSSKYISEINLENTKRSIILEVRQAVISVEEARENLEILKVSINQAEESLRLAKRSYEEGLQTYLDVQDAQNNSISTQNSYTSALTSYLVALSNLDCLVANHPKLKMNN